jgi:hypothetical protein
VCSIVLTRISEIKRTVKDYIDKIGYQLKSTKGVLEKMQLETANIKQEDDDNTNALIRVREQQVAGKFILSLFNSM